MHKRWYDIDPTVSLAVSLLRNADEETQIKCAEFTVKSAQSRGVMLPGSSINSKFHYMLKRWYDKDQRVSEAFEYLQHAQAEVQRELSLEIINYLQFSEQY